MRRNYRFTKENTPILLLVLLGLRIVSSIVSMIRPEWISWLVFDPDSIFAGQIWRLFTFAAYPNAGNTVSILLELLFSFFYFSIGRNLIQVIGKFRLNFFLISGLILEVVLGFLYYIIMSFVPELSALKAYVALLSPDYLYPMLFVLFAMIFPDAQFLLMFIIPIRGKWLVFIMLGLYVLNVIQAFSISIGYAWIIVVMIVAAVLALILYFLIFSKSSSGTAFKKRTRTAAPKKEKTVQRTPKAERMRMPGKEARHKCAICGRTEKTNPELEFRYCSKCVGNYEYCSDHLYTHLHKYPNITDVK